MRLQIGLTGGIASGKSIVAEIFKSLGIPVYNSDQQARWLMQNSPELKQQLINALGNIYLEDGSLNKPLLRRFVFADPGKRQIINDIVHPAVNDNFIQWASKQESKYVVKESALLFESGNYKTLDFNILVFCPIPLRIKRLIKRDKISQQAALQKIKAQMDEREKMSLADFVIINDKFTPILPQVLNLHKFFLIHAF